MTRTNQINLLGVVSSSGDAISRLKSPGDAVLVERGRPRLLMLSCPCGCGDQLPINLDSRSGPAWRIYQTSKGITLFPSVWRETGCESHFIIWRNEILLFGRYEGDWDDSGLDDGTLPDSNEVLLHLPQVGLVSFSKVADSLNADPWDVLRVCRTLVRSGLAHEGRGRERGSFGQAVRK
jgi:hypothetical protein